MNETDKIKTLRELVNEYLTYIDRWEEVEVYFDRFHRAVFVTWFKVIIREEAGVEKEYTQFTRREIPLDSLDERIKSYRNKINYAKKK